METLYPNTNHLTVEQRELQIANEVFIKQQAYYNSGETRSISFRKKQLKKIFDLIEQYEPQLYEAIYKDFKKSKFDTMVSELGVLKAEIKHTLSKIESWSRTKTVWTNPINLPGKSTLVNEPFGTCFVIGAWNYPYNLTLVPVISAIAAGNVVIIKPSGTAAHTAEIMAKMINDNFPQEYLHVVRGRGSIVDGILQNPFDKVFFTGSPKTGKEIMKLCANNLSNVTLELGGKSPAVFTKEGMNEVSFTRFAWGKFFNAGQTCIAPDYVLVPKNEKEKFLQGMKKAINKMIGDHKTSESFCQIITERHVDNLAKLIDPNKVYCGGNVDRENRFIEPTILFDVELSDAVMQDEIFGPILPVLTYEKIEDAIAIIRKFPKPLSFHYYTGSNRKVTKTLLESIPSGTGTVNDSMVFMANSNLPFGGVGNSGIGKYHGKFGYDTFSNTKGVLDRPNWYELPFKYRPYSSFKYKLIEWFLSL
jgi:aldehyde dehydrogenase (NAD+)